MDKRIKLFGTLAIAFLLLVTPASAQIWLSIVSTEVQVHYDNRWDATSLIIYSNSWAQKVVDYAKAHGTTPTRSVGDIAREIRLHAYSYLSPWPSSAAQPVNIGTMEPDGAYW